MKLARSTYYYRGRRLAAEKRVLRERVEALCAEFPRDGYRRITYQLRAEGMVVNHKAVARLMRQNGLQVRPLRKFVRTTDSDHDGPIFPTLPAASTQRVPISSLGGYAMNTRPEMSIKKDSRRELRSSQPELLVSEVVPMVPGAKTAGARNEP